MSSPPPPPVQGGRPLLRARIGGIPIHLDLSFVLFIGLLGWASARSDLRFVVTFVVVATLAVALHELGHAVVVVLLGGRPAVSLAGFGGVTSWVPPRQMRRWELIAVSVTGPAVGLVLWPVIVGVEHWLAPSPGSLLDDVLNLGKFTTLGWSLLNLLPVLPMDGGQILRELLPGDPPTRARRAAAASVGTGAVLGLLAWSQGETYLVVFFTLFVGLNVLALRGATGERAASAPPDPIAVPELDGPPLPADAPAGEQLVTALWQGRRHLAREILARAEPPVGDLAAHGAALAVSDDPAEQAQGLALLQQELAARPGEPGVAGLATLALTLRHDWAALAGLLDSAPAPDGVQVGGNVAVRAVQEAWRSGDLVVVGQLVGAALYRWPTRPGAPALAYLGALASIARAGQGGSQSAAQSAAHAAAQSAAQAWTALAGVPGAAEFAALACRGAELTSGDQSRHIDVRAVQPPLEALPAFVAAREALRSAMSDDTASSGPAA